jgi:cell division protein FtsZ
VSDVAQTVLLVAAIVVGGALMLRILALVPGRVRRLRRPETRAILVVGVGGGGSNAVDRMVAARIPGVSFVACNTDAQGLRQSSAPTKVRIGESTTGGLGSGGDPEVGRRSAEEDEATIARAVAGADLVFITAGLGGGTGSGAAPIIAADARRNGALTIAVVTKPFAFEGGQRWRIAVAAEAELAESVDAIITIPNDRVVDVVADDASMLDAFIVVDDVLLHSVRGISDLLSGPGLINLDFADVRAVLHGAGPALIGLGRGSGENRSIEAARKAIASPLLEGNIQGARRILFNVSGPADLRLREVRAAADEIRSNADPDANVIFGASLSDRGGAEVLITVIATGLVRSNSAETATRAAERRTLEPEIAAQRYTVAEPGGAGSSGGGARKRKPKVPSMGPRVDSVTDTGTDDETPALSEAPSAEPSTDEKNNLGLRGFRRRR